MPRRSELCLAFAFVAAGCATPTGTMHSRDSGKALLRLEGAKAAAEYEAILKRFPAPTKTQAEYSRLLKREIEAMVDQGSSKLSADASLGIASYFDQRVETVTQARLGLARLALRGGRGDEAASQARQALKAVQGALSPFLLASRSREAYGILREAYAAAGRGKVLVAKLNEEMLGDYVSSPKGVRDYYRSLAARQNDEKVAAELNKFLREVADGRDRAARQSLSEFAAGVGQIAGQMQQTMAKTGMAKQTPQLQMQQQLNDMSMRLAAVAIQATEDSPAEAVPTSPSALTHAAEGGGSTMLVKSFASAVQEIAPDAAVKGLAREVEGMADELSQAKAATRSTEKAQRFLGALTKLLSAAESIR